MYALARIVMVRTIARCRPVRRTSALGFRAGSIFDVDADALAASLRADGFDARLRLPATLVGEIVCLGKRVSASTPCAAQGPPFEVVERIAKDPALERIAALYLGVPAIYRGSRLWWKSSEAPGDPRESGTRFHYDLYDYGSLAFLFYLSDVDASAGPHVCVRASHRFRRWRDQLHPRRHRSDEEVIRSYGRERIITIHGPAGTVIAEDPFCLHKGTPLASRRRLALQLLYTRNAFPAPPFSGPAGAAGSR